MATETLTELDLFHRFVGELLARGEKTLSPQQSLERFVAYRQDVEKLEAFLRPAFEEYERGECGPIDWDRLKSRVRDRLAAEGVTDEVAPNG